MQSLLLLSSDDDIGVANTNTARGDHEQETIASLLCQYGVLMTRKASGALDSARATVDHYVTSHVFR